MDGCRENAADENRAQEGIECLGSSGAPPSPDAARPVDEAAEEKVAWWCVGAVLLTLTLVKPLGSIAVIGTIGFTFAALLQLYLPLWRADKLSLDYAFIGLHFRTWRRDLKLVLLLCLITFPPYALGHHLFMTEAHGWASELGLDFLLRYLPHRQLAPSFPETPWGWLAGGWWLLQITATHLLGVALPEETFYRGYLQPRLQHRWSPERRVLGVPFGKAALVAAALFALGHFLGEWNPLRLAPFFPALLFAWQRNASGSAMGAIMFHAACNVFGELLFVLYSPGS